MLWGYGDDDGGDGGGGDDDDELLPPHLIHAEMGWIRASKL